MERTSISSLFVNIYATTFIYDSNREVTEVDYLMSDKNKVEAIKDIIRTIGNKTDDCQNIIYIGDGFTDYYAMEYIKRNGGTSIFVYKNEDNQDLRRLEEAKVINFSAKADFSNNSELSNYIKKIKLSMAFSILKKV